MKRTALKRKTSLRTKKPMKRTKRTTKAVKRPKSRSKARTKRPSLRLLQSKLWKECKRITRLRYGNTCYTCGIKDLSGSNWHTGHSKPKAALPLKFKFDIRGLRPQCYHCNVNLGGVTDIFISKLAQEDDGYQFLIESCYYDEDANAWRIRQDIPTMGGLQAIEFISSLIKEYSAIQK